MKREKTEDGYDLFDAGSEKIKVTRIEEKKHKEKRGRQYIAVLLIISFFAGFISLLFNMQIMNGSEYEKLGSTSVVTSTVEPTRGEILDRNGKVLVGNKQGKAVVFNGIKFPSANEKKERNNIILTLINLFESNGIEWIDELPIEVRNNHFKFKADSDYEISRLISKDMLDLNRYASADDCMKALISQFELEDYSKTDARKIASVCYNMQMNIFNKANTYVFAEDVGDEVTAYIKERSDFFKGVDVEVKTYRMYYDGSIAPHILGMVGKIDAEEYKKLKTEGYGMNDIIGKNGIEAALEKELKGESGEKTVTTNSDGSVDVTFTKEVKNGNSIVLTIDSGLQKATQDALESMCKSIVSPVPHGGSAVVMNCNTGEVLAMATYPTFDLGTYEEEYKNLISNKASPLWNRAVLSTYAPGSTSKPSVAVAALEEGVITENTTEECYYKYRFLDRTFSCVASHRINNIDVRTALQDSCNIFFYKTGYKLGITKMNTYRELFGLGQSTGIEINENKGILDSPSYRESIGQTWRPGFTLQSAIGQAGNLFSPLQLANYCATIANGGTRYSVHVVKEIKSFDLSTTVIEKEPKVVVETGISEKTMTIVKEGMRRVITNSYQLRNGVGKAVECAAKTGTSEVEYTINGKKVVLNNGFFITFAPYKNPEIAVAVAIEGGKSGTSVSPVAKAIYDYYFNDKVDTSAVEQEVGTLLD